MINVSEATRTRLVERIATAAGPALLDVHTDRDHNRTVLTLAGPDVEQRARDVARTTVEVLDLRAHTGVHPRIGVLDVVPFVPLDGSTLADAVGARDRFARWAGAELSLPCFLYGHVNVPDRPAGDERTLPEVRRGAFRSLSPDTGPDRPHPSAGGCAVGARPVLVAYNLWLAEGISVARAREVAAGIRGPAVRALGLDVGGRAQVSCNLVAPAEVGPGAVYDLVAAATTIARAELVGLVPAWVLDRESPERWGQLDLDPSRTIEARLREAGLDGGRFDC